MSSAILKAPQLVGYYWFRLHRDASTFVACRDENDGNWYICGVEQPIRNIEAHATLLGPVASSTSISASINP